MMKKIRAARHLCKLVSSKNKHKLLHLIRHNDLSSLGYCITSNHRLGTHRLLILLIINNKLAVEGLRLHLKKMLEA